MAHVAGAKKILAEFSPLLGVVDWVVCSSRFPEYSIKILVKIELMKIDIVKTIKMCFSAMFLLSVLVDNWFEFF
jgi:hypothetical protein